MRKLLEFWQACHEISFAVNLDNHADTARMHVALDQTFARLAVAFFLGLGQAFLTQCLESFIKVTLGFN